MKRFSMIASLLLLVLATGMTAFAQSSTEVGPDFLKTARHLQSNVHPPKKVNLDSLSSSSLPGIDSIVNFTGQFNANGIGVDGSPQNLWSFSMVGNDPQEGGTTLIPAPIIPVSLDLLAADGSVAMHYDVSPFVLPTLLSPIFFPAKFLSSPHPTQWGDADMRATFFHSMRQDWHTLLNPQLKRSMTMTLPFGKYVAQPNSDGSCCLFVLVDDATFQNLLFPPTFPVDNTTLIGAAELNGDMTTKDLTTFLFPNTYLYENGDVNQCCVLGFHTFDSEPGIPANGNLPRAYMMDYSSWITPGLFGAGFQDVTALSHEVAETFNDPFVGFDNVHNITPWWLSGSQCQDLLEVGDVVESLPANVTIPVKNILGQTYNLQNVALLQWFEFQQHSDAFQAAYSFPSKDALPDLSPFENPGCAP
jgi:hypothetical protein